MFENMVEQVILSNRILDYLVALSLFLGSIIVIKIFQAIVLKRLKVWAEKTATTLDDFIVNITETIITPLLYFGAFFLSINILKLYPLLKRAIDIIGVGILTLFITRGILAFVNYGFKIYAVKSRRDMALERSLAGILRIVRLVIWSIAIIFFLDNLGFKISAVIAGLGIGGIAVALAAQTILKDILSYVSILFDRPFEIGDFIIVGDLLGSVEHIGIKTTRIRSLGGEQLIFSNTDLTDSRVRNYKRMEKRRVLFKLGVTYQTSSAHLEFMPKVIEDIIKNVKDTIFDRAHFSSYGDFSLIFEMVYYVLSSDYNKYMDIQQEINFAIKKKFAEEGIEFAYPTQTLYVNKTS